MKISLNLFANLAALLPTGSKGHSCSFECSDGLTMEQLLTELKIPENVPKLVFINGLHAKKNQVLIDGDRVAVFPPIAGG